MFIVMLKFTDNKAKASQFMQAHNAWIKQGFDEGVFLLLGGLQPNLGGMIMTHNTHLAALQDRVNKDPFVMEGIVHAEILEFNPVKADQRLAFLLG